jgi:hypothetical protein
MDLSFCFIYFWARLVCKLFLIFTVMAMLVGCGEMPVSSGYALRSDDNKGLVVISTTMFRFDNVYVGINNIGYAIDLDDGSTPGGPRDKSFVEINSACSRYEWYDPAMSPGSEYGCVSAFELPPGKYVLTYVYALGGGVTSENIEPYKFKFSVNSGSVTYFGNMAVKIPDLGRARIGHVTFDVRRSDQRKRDIALFLKKNPKIKASDVLYGSY